MEEKKIPTIGITLGDVNGVGPQTVLKAIGNETLFKSCQIIIFGSDSVLQFYKKQFPNLKAQYNILQNAEAKLNSKVANLYECSDKPVIINMGVSSEYSGQLSLKFLNDALDFYQKGRIDAIVTAPLNKSMIKTNPIFNGHTDYITSKLGEKESLMMMIDGDLRVALATHHIPLAKVSEHLTINSVYNKIKVLNHSLTKDFNCQRPKIAVLALNPHAGEKGTLGKEEIDVLIPAIEKAQKEKVIVQGPFSADGFFASEKFKHFDAILAMYHDQGLIPFKYISFMEGVNYTANLTLIRTSPDHGTANDLVETNDANPNSLINAIYQAVDIYHTRAQQKLMKENPLKKHDIRD